MVAPVAVSPVLTSIAGAGLLSGAVKQTSMEGVGATGATRQIEVNTESVAEASMHTFAKLGVFALVANAPITIPAAIFTLAVVTMGEALNREFFGDAIPPVKEESSSVLSLRYPFERVWNTGESMIGPAVAMVALSGLTGGGAAILGSSAGFISNMATLATAKLAGDVMGDIFLKDKPIRNEIS